jgi:RimJ/RimL family protein N-acetyltransferase
MSIDKPILLDLAMPIRTPRLVIYPAHPKHAEAFHAAKVESMDIFYPWMPWSKDGSGTLDDTRELLTRAYAQFILREGLMLLAFTHEGEFVVSSGMHKLDWDLMTCEIGYWCRKSARGKGYVTEASNAIARYAFDLMKMNKVSIGMDSENKASESVAKRLNMKKEFEMMFGIKTLHEDKRRKRLSYTCFSASDLPPLEVRWG